MSLQDDIRAAAENVSEANEISLVSHIDADGITSEAILAIALTRLGIPIKQIFVRQMEPATMEAIPNDDSLKIFTDLGAGQQALFE